MAKTFGLRALAVAATLVACGSVVAQTSSGAARVTNTAWGGYYTDTSLSIQIGSTQLPDYNNTQWFGSDYKTNFGDSAGATPAPAVMSSVWNGDPLSSPATVTVDARAGTTWGANHVYASLSGFDPFNVSTTSTLCPTLPGSGQCIPGMPEQIQTFTSNNRAYAAATSRWEEIYATGGGAGSLGTTFGVHVTLGSAASGSGAPNGSSYFQWTERDFRNQTVASFNASYDAASDSWWANTYSNAVGTPLAGWQSYSGTGSFTIGGTSGVTLVSSEGVSFDGTIYGNRDFATGEVVYVDSTAQASVSGNGVADSENTVKLLNLQIPTGVRIFAQSGTNYAGIASGGGGGGGICLDAACVVGSGGGGGNPLPVPEPETYALWLAGLGMLGAVSARRRRSRL